MLTLSLRSLMKPLNKTPEQPTCEVDTAELCYDIIKPPKQHSVPSSSTLQHQQLATRPMRAAILGHFTHIPFQINQLK